MTGRPLERQFDGRGILGYACGGAGRQVVGAGPEQEGSVEPTENVSAAIMDLLRERLGDRVDEYSFPPPVFGTMEAEFLALDLVAGTLSVQFPVLEQHLNPYRTMQGGMIVAAVDNTFGPLSVLVAPPNVTRQLELTYSRPVTLGLGHIVVTARFLGREDRWLRFQAEVCGPAGERLARAKAAHWIVDGGDAAGNER